MLIRFGDDILLVDLYGPPPYGSHPVLDRSDREVPFLPLLYQGLDVFRFEGPGLHLSVAQGMQFVGN